MAVRIFIGDCRDVLKTLDAESVQCVVTSPPYYGLRDYGVSGQIGLEQSPDEYVAEMVGVFREVRRRLRKDGTVWLNLGDSYASSTKGSGGATEKQASNVGSFFEARKFNIGDAKPKDLLGIPWRVAFALQADGWWLRSAIVWAKPNPMPESVTDRPTSSYEMVFLLAKSASYFYDAEAIKEEGIIPAGTLGAKGSDERASQVGVNSRPTEYKLYDGTRNARNVWTITTRPYSGAHFATMPPDLAERCILAGTSERGCCPHCGAPWERQVERSPTFEGGSGKAGRTAEEVNASGKRAGQQYGKNIKLGPVVTTTTTGWRPTCSCPEHTPIPCTVLDPFGGAGTTGLVADRINRNSILIELNPQYAQLARERIAGDAPLLTEVA